MVLGESHKLSLFLRLKEAYMKAVDDGMSKGEYYDVFCYKILSDKRNLKSISLLIAKTTYLFPRIHSFVPLLLNEVSFEAKTADKMKLLSQLAQALLNDYMFNDEVYS